MRLNWVCRMGKIMLLLILSLGACSEEKEGELCFVGDSLVAGWDVKECFSHMDCTKRWCEWREVGGDCYLESELSRQKCSDVDRNEQFGRETFQ